MPSSRYATSAPNLLACCAVSRVSLDWTQQHNSRPETPQAYLTCFLTPVLGVEEKDVYLCSPEGKDSEAAPTSPKSSDVPLCFIVLASHLFPGINLSCECDLLQRPASPCSQLANMWVVLRLLKHNPTHTHTHTEIKSSRTLILKHFHIPFYLLKYSHAQIHLCKLVK